MKRIILTKMLTVLSVLWASSLLAQATGILATQADDTKIAPSGSALARPLSTAPGTESIPTITTEVRTFTTEKTVRPDLSAQPMTIHIFLSPTPFWGPSMPPMSPMPSQQPMTAMQPHMPGTQPFVFFMPPPVPLQSYPQKGCCLGCYKTPLPYPDPNLIAADPYRATQYVPSVVAPSMVVYPNGVMIKPKVYLPGKFCHNVFQAITP